MVTILLRLEVGAGTFGMHDLTREGQYSQVTFWLIFLSAQSSGSFDYMQ